MNILHVCKSALPEITGGVEVFVDNLCQSTAAFAVSNTVFALSKHPADEPLFFNGYRICQARENLFFASTGFSFSAFAMFKRLAADADVIHYHFPNPFADLLHFICHIKKPVIITYHSDIVKQKVLLQLYKPLQTAFLRAADGIVATSPNYLASSDVLRHFSDKVSVIPLAIGKENYPQVTRQKLDCWRDKLPQPFFLFVGVMRYYKGLYTILDAVKDTSINIVLAGSGGIEAELKAYAHRHNLTNVKFLGFVNDEDKVALLKLCYGFVFPSHLRSEAFGISLLEAAAYAKPMISCEIGTGTSYINLDGITGLVIKPESPGDLKQAMLYLLNHPNKAGEYGKNAQKRYQERFQIASQARDYYKLYQTVSASQPANN